MQLSDSMRNAQKPIWLSRRQCGHHLVRVRVRARARARVRVRVRVRVRLWWCPQVRVRTAPVSLVAHLLERLHVRGRQAAQVVHPWAYVAAGQPGRWGAAGSATPAGPHGCAAGSPARPWAAQPELVTQARRLEHRVEHEPLGGQGSELWRCSGAPLDTLVGACRRCHRWHTRRPHLRSTSPRPGRLLLCGPPPPPPPPLRGQPPPPAPA